MVVICPECRGSGQDPHTTIASSDDLCPCGRCNGYGKLENHWITREGEILNIPDMESSHIRNCILMLERNVSKFRYIYEISHVLSLPEARSDNAQDAINEEIDQMCQMTDVEWLRHYHKTYMEFMKEVEVRGDVL